MKMPTFTVTSAAAETVMSLFPANEDGRVYYPMLFTHEKPFEELFCICLQLLNKTWKEMRAAAADFSKVMAKCVS